MSLLMRMILGATSPSTLARFEEQCRDPMRAQRELLQRILSQNAPTAFGKSHGFGTIRSSGAFQRRLPIGTYESHSAYIDRMLQGEPAQLTAEAPVMFAMTSGTTGKPKYIPVTPESRSAKSQLMRVWLSSLFTQIPAAFNGKILVVVSPEEEERAPCGAPCGAESGHGYRNMPAAVKPLYVCPYEVYKLKSSEAKYYAMLRYAVQHPVSTIFTCNPSTVIKLSERLGEFTERLIDDVAAGTLRSDLCYAQSPDLWAEYERVRGGLQADPQGRVAARIRDESAQVHARIAGALRADRARAQHLRQAAAAGGGRLLPRHVWPELAAVSCWTGGTVGQYLKHFPKYLPDDIAVRDIGYLASELRGSAPLASTSRKQGWAKVAGPLAVNTNFYEFYPAERDGKPDPVDLLTLDQLESGRQYFVYVTTLGGLYRYDMNDIIRVDGFYGDAPLISFVQKGKGVTSITGEKLYEAQAIMAVEEALKGETHPPTFIAAVGVMPDPPQPAYYIFLVEYPSPPTEEKALETIRRIDQALQRVNEEYLTKRKDRIGPAVLRVLRPGAEEAYRTRQTEGGKKNDGQFKYMKLTLDPAFLKEFDDHKVRDYEAG